MITSTVLGARGQVGSLLLRELGRAGHRVNAVARSGPPPGPPPESPDAARDGQERNVVWRQADLSDPAGTATAAEGSDVIFHVAGAPYADWPRRLPDLLESAISAARAQDAVLVYLDNLYGYAPSSGPLRPDSPQRPVGALGRVRAQLSDRLQHAGVAWVIVRVSDFYGTGPVRSTPQALVLDRLTAGRPGQWPIRLDRPHALHFLPDVARGLATVGVAPQATGRVWHLPAAPAPTGREFIRLAADAFGQPERAAALSGPMLRLAGLVNRDARDLRSLAYQYAEPFLLESGETTETFGSAVAPTAHDRALAIVAAENTTSESSGRRIRR